MTDRTLADEALSNLVDQFARPLDFLRELVQNALDAGTPRVEVTTHWQPDGDEGLFAIRVRDFGAGMDERIIDTELTRLFASSKAGDLTKIGKFGIGFASVFALRPDAVEVRTGRLGQAWRVVFDRDRTFDKVPLDEAFAGTEVTVVKRIPAEDRRRLVAEVRFVLGYWCEHTERPVRFADRTAATETPASDPFAIASGDWETVNRPFVLHADLVATEQDGDVVAHVGLSDSPRYTFTSGGLTLLSTQDPSCLGPHADALAHLSFKVRSPHLAHTLTRDNVLHDDGWARAMSVVRRAHRRLHAALLDRIETSVEAGEDPERWWRSLAAEVRSFGRDAIPPDRRLFRDTSGTPRTLADIEAQEDDVGVILVADDATALADALADAGRFLLPDTRGLRAVFAALPRPDLLGLLPRRRAVRTASERFVLLRDTPAGALTPAEGALLAAVRDLARRAGLASVRLGDFGGPVAGAFEPLAHADTGDPIAVRHLPAPGATRIVVNRNHPWWQAQRVVARDDVDLAAFAVLHAAGHVLSLSERRMNALLAAA